MTAFVFFVRKATSSPSPLQRGDFAGNSERRSNPETSQTHREIHRSLIVEAARNIYPLRNHLSWRLSSHP